MQLQKQDYNKSPRALRFLAFSLIVERLISTVKSGTNSIVYIPTTRRFNIGANKYQETKIRFCTSLQNFDFK